MDVDLEAVLFRFERLSVCDLECNDLCNNGAGLDFTKLPAKMQSPLGSSLLLLVTHKEAAFSISRRLADACPHLENLICYRAGLKMDIDLESALSRFKELSHCDLQRNYL
jgi:hypothetical protein